WPITLPLHPSPSVAWRARSAWIMPRKRFSTLPRPMERRARFARSVCPIPIWTPPPVPAGAHSLHDQRAGYRTLITHLFLQGDRYLDSDAVFGVKPSLIISPRLIAVIKTVDYDFGLSVQHDSTRVQVDELRRQRR